MTVDKQAVVLAAVQALLSKWMYSKNLVVPVALAMTADAPVTALAKVSDASTALARLASEVMQPHERMTLANPLTTAAVQRQMTLA
jgi:hypothetical protein